MGDFGCVQSLGQTEVEHFYLAVRLQLHVGRLQVAVDDALLVRLLEPLCDLSRDRERLFERQRPAGDAGGEVFALDVLHRQEPHVLELVDAVDGGDVAVIERGQQLGLAFEPRQPRRILGDAGGQRLDGDLAAQGPIRGPPHHAHAAFTDPRRERVVQECLPGVQHGL